MTPFIYNQQLVIEEFKNHSGIVYVASYLWTNKSNEPFTCVTLHYTNSNMKLQKKILGFCKILHSHDGSSIYDSFWQVFLENMRYKTKNFSITFDNASNNKSVLNLFVRTIREGHTKFFALCPIFSKHTYQIIIYGRPIMRM